MNKIRLLFVSISLLTLSCSKEESDIRLAEFETPVITGFELRDEQSNKLEIIGTPNIKLGNESNDYNSEYFFKPYPNPCSDRCWVHIKTPNSNTTAYIWIVQAQYNENSISTTTNLGNSTLLSLGGAPFFQSEISSSDIGLDLSSLSEGYYRIYLKVDDLILYDNLLITNNL